MKLTEAHVIVKPQSTWFVFKGSCIFSRTDFEGCFVLYYPQMNFHHAAQDLLFTVWADTLAQMCDY